MNAKSTAAMALALVLWSSAAFALPATVEVSDTNRDATLILTTRTQTILGDARSLCTVQIQVGEDAIEFSDGDDIVIRVYENDFIGDDLIWQTTYNVTNDEVDAGQVDQTFDCSSAFPEGDIGNEIEIYAEADVNKDECGFFCNLEEPQTTTIDLEQIEDDGEEEDDSDSDANVIGIGLAEGRIARDQDWFFLNVDPMSTNIRFTVLHNPIEGRLEVALFNEALERLADGVDTDANTILTADALPVGTYWLRIQPQVSNDFNFYDMRLLAEPNEVECTPGDTESQACGNCGMQTRLCGEDSTFGSFGACMEEGVCAPGDERQTACGNCGTVSELCTDTCAWGTNGECTGEGECARGNTETMACEGGTQARVCDDACQWGEFGVCEGNECEDGDERACYDGPDGTAGVGVCREGRQFCEGGRFGMCQSQIGPGPELCSDLLDNDCDGQRDGDDPDCTAEGAEIGSACAEDGECAGDLNCLEAPDNAQFEGGYCGKDDCDGDGDCGADGVCGQVFGQRFCLRACGSAPDCRRGYICTDVVGSSTACVPGCRDNDDCTDATRPICDPGTELCVDGPDPNPGMNPDPNPTPGPGMNPDPQPGPQPVVTPQPEAPPTGSQGDDGCCTVPPSRPTRTPWVLAMLVGLLAVMRWRD